MVVATSLYVGVSKPRYRSRGWVAQKKSVGVWRGGFETQEEAAAWLAKALGVSRPALLRTSGFSSVTSAKKRKHHQMVVSQYRGVVHRRRLGCSDAWEARGAHNTYIGTFASEKDAAAAVARVLGVRVSKLKRKQPFTRRAACALFRASYKVFRRYQPGDLQHLYLQESACEAVFRKETRGRLAVRW